MYSFGYLRNGQVPFYMYGSNRRAEEPKGVSFCRKSIIDFFNRL